MDLNLKALNKTPWYIQLGIFAGFGIAIVGMLNLNGSMTKAGIKYSSLWSEDFTDKFFKNGLRRWLEEGVVTHDQSHVLNLTNES